MEPVVISHCEESSLTSQITKKQVDHIFCGFTDRLPEDYPKKLALNISPECSSATSASGTWILSVVGLEDELSFELTSPSLSSTHTCCAWQYLSSRSTQLCSVLGQDHS